MATANVCTVVPYPQVYTVRVAIAGLSNEDIFPITHSAVRIAFQPDAVSRFFNIRFMRLDIDHIYAVRLERVSQLLRSGK